MPQHTIKDLFARASTRKTPPPPPTASPSPGPVPVDSDTDDARPVSRGEKSPAKKKTKLSKLASFLKSPTKLKSVAEKSDSAEETRPQTANSVAASYIDEIIRDVRSLPEQRVQDFDAYQQTIVAKLSRLQNSLVSGDPDQLSIAPEMPPKKSSESVSIPSKRLSTSHAAKERTSILSLVHSKIPSQQTEGFVTQSIMRLITRLYSQRPSHPMFGDPGEPGSGIIRAPYSNSRSIGGVSWEQKAKQIGMRVAKHMGESIPRGSCWMVADDSAGFQRKDGGTIVNFKIVRFLAFLKEPTDQNWHALQDEKLKSQLGVKSAVVPFCHNCHNGLGSQKKSGEHLSCINGIEHGVLGSSKMNHDQAVCNNKNKDGSRRSCRGHGDDGRAEKEFCFFVHRSGVPKYCRNLDRDPGPCACAPACY